MANTNLYNKNVRQRGTHGGILDSVTGQVRVPASGSEPGPINVMRLGEGISPVRVVCRSYPAGVTGTFALTLVADHTGPFARPDGKTFPALAAPFALGSVVLDANGEAVLADVNQPTSVFGPTKLVATGAAANGAAVDAVLQFSVEFVPEQTVGSPLNLITDPNVG